MLDAMLRCAGYRVGLYTSPHLLRYNERVVIDGAAVDDDALVEAFNEVEDARIAGDPPTPLTYFEFGTLAALVLFDRAALDAVILEVGLGGRLDAVNLVDADVAVLTSVDLDHMDYLGTTREDIGREKAGVFRPGRPAICARSGSAAQRDRARGRDRRDAASRRARLRRGRAKARSGVTSGRAARASACRIRHCAASISSAMRPPRSPRSRACATASPCRRTRSAKGLTRVELPGRFMVLPGRPTVVLDVAHNPHAARALASCLGSMGFHPQTTAVVGMLADKDIDGVIAALRARIDRWHVAPLPGPRGARADQLRDRLVAAGVDAEAIRTYPDVERAYEAAAAGADEADRIVVFGSFLTVAAALARGRPARPLDARR